METTLLLSQDQIGFPVLLVLLAVPLVAAGGLLMGAMAEASRQLALTAALLQTVLALIVTMVFDPAHRGMQLHQSLGPFDLGIDGLSVLFLPLTAVLTLLCIIASGRRHWDRAARGGAGSAQDQARYFAAILGMSAALTGAFVAADMRLFWLFLSLEAVPAWYLLHHFGAGSLHRAAARDFAVVMVMAAGLSLIGIELLIGHLGGTGLDLIAGAAVPAPTQGVTFVILALAFAIRAPIFPFHGWLPRVLEHGPAMGLGVFLVGLKVGTYGLLRFVITPFPEAAAEYGWLVASLGGVGAIYGGLMALIQTDLRRLLAYASVAHMGVIIVGLFSLNAHGIEGGLLQMLTIGMAVAGLYILSSFVSDRVETPDIARLGGLAGRAPWLAGAFILTALAAVGMPGTSGFNGEHLVVIGAYESHPAFALMVGASTVLTAAYLLRFFQRAFMDQGHADTRKTAFPDLRPRERAVAGTMAALVLVVGLFTGPFIALTRTGVEDVVARMPGAHGTTGHGVQGGEQTTRLAPATATPAETGPDSRLAAIAGN